MTLELPVNFMIHRSPVGFYITWSLSHNCTTAEFTAIIMRHAWARHISSLRETV